jgi:alpha-D-ribose 1-methylphosphonate 5-triphosphate synthase subunit PhnG
MRVERRFEALSVADGCALESLADEILVDGETVSVAAGPESVSAPIRVSVPGSGDTTVVIGHVALTRCTVQMGETRGDGVRVGYDPVGAVSAAICDAECERAGPLARRVHDLCRTAEQGAAERAAERARLVAATRLEQS